MWNPNWKILKNKKEEKTSEPNDYEKEVVIDDLTYVRTLWLFNSFDDERNTDLKIYRLDFGTKEHGDALTNKGLAVFRQLSKEMRDFFNEVNQKEHIDAITFRGSRSKLNTEEYTQMKTVGRNVEEKLKQNPHLLDGFYKEQDGKKIKIENGYLILDGDFKKNGSFGIKAIAEETIKPPEMPDWFKPAIWKFLYKDSIGENLIDKALNESDEKALQRLALYEYILKRNFSEYEFERVGDDKMRTVVYINPEKKDAVREEIERD